MKRALVLVPVVAILLLLTTQPGTNTKATPNHTTPTDVVDDHFEVSRLASAKAEFERKEASTTPAPSPRPAPEATAIPRETGPSDTTSTVVPNSDRLRIEKGRITFYDCVPDGYCGRTASGVILEKGVKYAACDTDYWPFGTQMVIDGEKEHWICVDTGSLVVGPGHWDVWFYDRKDGEKYLEELGSDTVPITILPR